MPATLTPTEIDVGAGEGTSDRKAPLFNVVLLDDDEHTYAYVIEMLMRLFLFGEASAYRHAVEVDTLGRTVVLTSELEQAQFACDQIHGFGRDPRMAISRGSMRAVVEPAADGTG